MAIYFLLLNARRFHEEIVPALTASWQRRSFGPCQSLCAALVPEAVAFRERYDAGSAEPLLCQVARGQPFERDFWRLLVGEVLLYAAVELPEIQTAPDTLCCLLAPDHNRQGDTSRETFSPIEQAHFGSRDLVFRTAFYRPEYAGHNDSADVTRLAAYLDTIDSSRWSANDLQDLVGLEALEDRQEELEYARDWFPSLREMYRQARQHKYVIICESTDRPRDL